MANNGSGVGGAPDGDTLRAFIHHGPNVAFIKDGGGRYLYVNPAMERLFGVAGSDVHGYADSSWLPPRIAEAIPAQDAHVLTTGESTEALDSITVADGSVQYWRVVKFAFPGPDGQRLVGGIATNVTDLQHARAQLMESERRYRHLVESAQGLICTHDMNGTLLTVNQAALTLTGLTADQVIGRNLGELLSQPSRDVFPLYLERINQVGSDAGMMYVRSTSGRELVWQYRNVKVEDPGQAPYVLGHAQDVTELRDAHEQLRRQAMTDDLTGLHNRRGFLVNGSRAMAEAALHHKGAAVFYLDIDGLKNINDRYGHDAGSALIVAAAEALKNSFRAADILARIGGDEFVALIIVPPDDVATITNRLRWHLDKFNENSELPYELTMSIGVSHFDRRSGQTLEDMVKQADSAMYRQKRPGAEPPVA